MLICPPTTCIHTHAYPGNDGCSTDGELEAVIRKLPLENTHQLLSDAPLLVDLGKRQSFVVRAIAADRTNVDHAAAVFDKGAAFDGNVKTAQIGKDKVDKALILFFPQVPDKRLCKADGKVRVCMGRVPLTSCEMRLPSR